MSLIHYTKLKIDTTASYYHVSREAQPEARLRMEKAIRKARHANSRVTQQEANKIACAANDGEMNAHLFADMSERKAVERWPVLAGMNPHWRGWDKAGDVSLHLARTERSKSISTMDRSKGESSSKDPSSHHRERKSKSF